MSIIDRIKNKYTTLKHNKRKINDDYVNFEKLRTLQDEIKAINKSVPLGTSSWENIRREIRRAILEDNIADFINWSVIQKTMFFDAPKVEYYEVKKNALLSKAIKEFPLGNPKPYFLDSTTSGTLVHHAFSIAQLFKVSNLKLNDFDDVIEFGGGYGSMCRLFKNMKYQGKYTIFDLPEFSALQRFYLSSISEEYVKDVVFTGEMSKLNDKPNSLFIATWSLSEAPIELREQLLSNLQFDYCVIAFQSEFDGINNVEYFKNFTRKYENIQFDIYPIDHLVGHFYLIGIKKK